MHTNLKKPKMRHLFAIAILMIAVSCSNSNSPDAKKTATSEVNTAAIKTIRLHVTGMTCEGCENTVKDAVTAVEGVTGAETSYVKELAVITYDSTLTTESDLSKVIDELGYKVEGPAPDNNESSQ